MHTELRELYGHAVIVLLRHARRLDIPQGEKGNELTLTEAGSREAFAFGELLSDNLVSIASSPIRRCVETAQQILQGSKQSHEIIQSRMLGDPGAFVHDAEAAWNNWLQIGNDATLHHLIHQTRELPGLYPMHTGAQRLLDFMLPALHSTPGYHLFVSHDIVITPFISSLTRQPLPRNEWPGFMQRLCIWREADGLKLAYQNTISSI